MKEIIVRSRKYGHHYAMVDDIDFELLSKYKWTLTRKETKSGGLICYANAHNKPRHKGGVTMHRLILGLTDPKVLCDHKDRNGLNNQRSNLRIATFGQNSQNKGVCRRNEAGFKGVVMNKENKYRKYCAIIIADGKRIFGGGFKNSVEAAYAWNEMARTHHGEFAYQNPVTAIKYHDGIMYTVEKKTPCSTPIKDKDFIIERVRTFVPYYRKRT